jgi:hypothetical protein
MANPNPNTSGLLKGGKPGPRAHTKAWREFCRAITLEDEVTMARYAKEMHNGTIDPSLERMIWAYAFGVPPRKFELAMDEGDRQRPVLRTRLPIGYDPLNPGNPDLKVIEAIYQHVPELPAAATPAGEPEPEGPAKPPLKSSIVPRPDLASEAEADQPGARKKRVPKRPPEDDGSMPLRVDGI